MTLFWRKSVNVRLHISNSLYLTNYKKKIEGQNFTLHLLKILQCRTLNFLHCRNFLCNFRIPEVTFFARRFEAVYFSSLVTKCNIKYFATVDEYRTWQKVNLSSHTTCRQTFVLNELLPLPCMKILRCFLYLKESEYG